MSRPPHNKPLERAGVKPCRPTEPVSAGRSAPGRQMGKASKDWTALATAWHRAAKDLGIDVVAPYLLDEEFEFVALVRNFGSLKGMLILASWDERCATAAEQHGFGYSCMDSPFYETYDRKLFVDVLTDWTWTGDPTTRPAWCTESSGDAAAI